MITFAAYLLLSLPLFASGTTKVGSSPMRIPENEASIKKDDKMPGVGIGSLRDSFNSSVEQVRVVSFLSPTCSACQDGHSAVKKIFTSIKSDRLKGFLMWLPMKSKDDAHMALAQSSNLKDRR